MRAPSLPISLDDLLAFNDELRAIVRAGIPLEHGLRVLGADLPGRLQPLAHAIGQRMERGESLAAVLHDPTLALPPIYSAVVAAGVRGGRLPAALESLSRSVRLAAEMRRTLIISCVYPFMVLLLASGVFIFTWLKLFPVMRQIVPELLDQQMPRWFQWLTWSVDHGLPSLVAAWVVTSVAGGVWLLRSRSGARFGGGGSWWPSIGSVNAAGQAAAFAETLALLLEQQVPMVEALSLAGASTGNRQLRTAADSLAERLSSGGSSGGPLRGLPPLLCWLIMTNVPSHQLVRSLRHTAATQRDRARRNSMLLTVYLPIILSAGVGGVVAVYYVILVITPFYYLMHQLGQP